MENNSLDNGHLDINYLKAPDLSWFMTLKYPIFEVKINKKFARTQLVTWQKRKELIFNIFNDISRKNKFNQRDENHVDYNLVSLSGDIRESLSVLPLNESLELIDMRILNDVENAITNTKVSSANYSGASFICLFKIGLIKHTDIEIFNNGTTSTLFSYIQNANAGMLHKTTFGVIVSERLQKMFLIKQSFAETINANYFLYYLIKKSISYQANEVDNTFKFIPLIKGRDFDINDVASIYELDIGINSDLINEYRTKTGETDAFYNLVLSRLAGAILGTGRQVKFSISFQEEGDIEAKQLFSELYNSFTAVYGEEIEKLFTNFKIVYESLNSNGMITINFKRDLKYIYEPENQTDSFNKILEGFVWLTSQINQNSGQNE